VPDAFYFGRQRRPLLGLRHAPPAALPVRAAMLACAPLLQDGIRCQRALWTLGEALAQSGVEVLRFDWFGSGDSPGATDALRLDGLVDDVAAGIEWLSGVRPGVPGRVLALREAAMPLLIHAARSGVAIDAVLWAPVLDGRALVDGWRRQHGWQLHAAGRFLVNDRVVEADELLGFQLHPAFAEELSTVDAGPLVLPAGSRLLVAHWPGAAVEDRFLQRQRAAGVDVRVVELDPADAPDWDDPELFETQLFPRRSVSRLAGLLAEAA